MKIARQQLQRARHVQFIRGSKAIAFSLLMAYLYFCWGPICFRKRECRPNLGLLLGAFLILCKIEERLALACVYWLRVRADLFIRRAHHAKQFLYLRMHSRRARRGFTRRCDCECRRTRRRFHGEKLLRSLRLICARQMLFFAAARNELQLCIICVLVPPPLNWIRGWLNRWYNFAAAVVCIMRMQCCSAGCVALVKTYYSVTRVIYAVGRAGCCLFYMDLIVSRTAFHHR